MSEKEIGGPEEHKGKVIKFPLRRTPNSVIDGLATQGSAEEQKFWSGVQEALGRRKSTPITIGDLFGGDELGFERMKRRGDTYPEIPDDLLDD